MKEFEFIKNLSNLFGKGISAIGDDATLIKDRFLVATDMMVENIHFLPTTPINHIINKLMTSNVSDISAMGGVAKYALFSIAASQEEQLEAVLEPLKNAAVRYNVQIVGGDTTRSRSGLVLSMTMIGEKSKNLLTRSGACPGDILFLSRHIGLARVSLERELGLGNQNIDQYYHYTLEAEDRLGAVLGSIPEITSCIDISDGLGRDANQIAKASNIKVVVKDMYLPYQKLSSFHLNQQEYIISSGEEYALLFTVPKNLIQEVMLKIREAISNDVVMIGAIESGSGAYLLCQNGMMKDISSFGHEHFAKK